MRKTLFFAVMVLSVVTVSQTALVALAPPQPAPEPVKAEPCSLTLECDNGCDVHCSGELTCSRTADSITCDGRTYTCESPRLCPAAT